MEAIRARGPHGHRSRDVARRREAEAGPEPGQPERVAREEIRHVVLRAVDQGDRDGDG